VLDPGDIDDLAKADSTPATLHKHCGKVFYFGTALDGILSEGQNTGIIVKVGICTVSKAHLIEGDC
jgi:hypothetical protein